MSIRVKVLGIVIGVIILLRLFVGIQLRQVLFANLEIELAEQGFVLNRNTTNLINTALANDDTDAVTSLITERREHYSSATHNTND